MGSLQLSEEELVARFYAGDDTALDELVARYRPLVAEHARRHGIIGRVGAMAGLAGLWQAIRGYDPSWGPFRRAASTSIDVELMQLQRRQLVARIRVLGRQVDRSLRDGDVEGALEALAAFQEE